MGANLSSTVVTDTSKVVLSPTDRAADIILGIIWLLVLYAMAVIFTTCALIDRWKGPTDRIRVGGGSVMAAIALSTAWPVVLLYLMFSN
ncbi:uncharacterized protein TCAP_04434 [Tolypocladium capitatum]|uniref:Uncharacterized protein n=1 Tax=Tolypocladium capitatum TaxID=45235 RepID=A0A2K3QDN3_9HYPO|nr:uncharacterized protein TCAP_04434 [Tolypocladium capitatum]